MALKEERYRCQIRFSEEGPTMQQQLELVLRSRIREKPNWDIRK